jgi:DNA repair exonuclease SbcCD ATPase subunit
MKVGGVYVADFLSIEGAQFNLTDRGLIAVQGENMDNTSAVSNGAGKSSLVDAIMWCLYGQTARGSTTDDVIRNGCKLATVIVDLLMDDGSRYFIERRRSKGKTDLKLRRTHGSPTVLDVLTLGTNALTQALIDKIIGCDAEVFRAAVYIGQEAMPDLPGMSDKQLKELIEQAAGLSVIEECYEKARAAAVTASKEVFDADKQCALINRALEIEVQNLKNISEDSDNWNYAHTANLAAASAHHSHSESAYHAANSIYTAALARNTGAIERLEEIKKELDSYAKASMNAIDAELVANKAKISHSAALVTARHAAAQLVERRAHLESLEAGDDAALCSHCGQALPSAARDKILETAKDAVTNALSGAHTAAAALKAATQHKEETGRLATAARDAVPDVDTLVKEMAVCEGHAKEVADKSQQALAAEAEMRRVKETLDKTYKESNPYGSRLIKIRDAVDTGAKAAKEAAARVSEAELERETAEGVVRVFSPTGMRAEVLDHVTPYLNARTAAYLDAMSDGTIKANWTTLVRDAKGNLKEKFSIQITHPAGEGFHGLSGGEKRKVRLAAALALQDLVASRATKPIDLFIADEVDDALDAAGLERLMGILNEKAAEKGTVLVISHNSLTDWVSNIWTVTKEKGVSSLSESS